MKEKKNYCPKIGGLPKKLACVVIGLLLLGAILYPFAIPIMIGFSYVSNYLSPEQITPSQLEKIAEKEPSNLDRLVAEVSRYSEREVSYAQAKEHLSEFDPDYVFYSYMGKNVGLDWNKINWYPQAGKKGRERIKYEYRVKAYSIMSQATGGISGEDTTYVFLLDEDEHLLAYYLLSQMLHREEQE